MPYYRTAATVELYNTDAKPGEPLGVTRIVVTAETEAEGAFPARDKAIEHAKELLGPERCAYITRTYAETA